MTGFVTRTPDCIAILTPWELLFTFVTVFTALLFMTWILSAWVDGRRSAWRITGEPWLVTNFFFGVRMGSLEPLLRFADPLTRMSWLWGAVVWCCWTNGADAVGCVDGSRPFVFDVTGRAVIRGCAGCVAHGSGILDPRNQVI